MMIAHRALLRTPPALRAYTFLHTIRAFSTTPLPNGITLAYDLHEPPSKNERKPNNAPPILFLHGLFGSKKNNRSMSKYASDTLPTLLRTTHPLTPHAESSPAT
jgi:hypothetical protein